VPRAQVEVRVPGVIKEQGEKIKTPVACDGAQHGGRDPAGGVWRSARRAWLEALAFAPGDWHSRQSGGSGDGNGFCGRGPCRRQVPFRTAAPWRRPAEAGAFSAQCRERSGVSCGGLWLETPPRSFRSWVALRRAASAGARAGGRGGGLGHGRARKLRVLRCSTGLPEHLQHSAQHRGETTNLERLLDAQEQKKPRRSFQAKAAAASSRPLAAPVPRCAASARPSPRRSSPKGPAPAGPLPQKSISSGCRRGGMPFTWRKWPAPSRPCSSS